MNQATTEMNHATAEPIIALKKALRRQTLARIALLDPAYVRDADRRIRERLLSLPEYAGAGTIFCFVGTDHEIDTSPFLKQILADGKTLCVPLCTGKRTMEARRITSLAQLKEGYCGILEPDPAVTTVLPPDRIDLAVIPCVTCSHAGARLGHGGGYYDIFFSQTKKAAGRPAQAAAVMICREQLICEEIPREAHDLTFPIVVTEAGVFRP